MADLQVKSPWYPLAKQHPLKADHYKVGSAVDKNSITLHITEGTTLGGAIATFENSSGKGTVSAHFINDRDGSITQLVAINNIAWHARQANAHAIGIEHVALSQPGADYYNKKYADKIAAGKQKKFEHMPATEAQYVSSAKLIVWLCKQLSIGCDRSHIRTHNEASPIDDHVLCCTGALDPDRLVNIARAIPIGCLLK